MENLWKNLLIVSMLAGCASEPLTFLQKEEREYKKIDEITQLQFSWHECLLNRGTLLLKFHVKYYRKGIQNTLPKYINLSDARSTYCVKQGYF